MNSTIFFSVCSLFYCILLITTLYTRKEGNDAEKKILKILAFINLGNLLCEVVGIFLGKNYDSFELLNNIALRLMLILYIVWFSFFGLFVLNVSKKEKKFSIKNNAYVYIIMIFVLIVGLLLPINYITNAEGVIIYSTGPAVQLDYYYAMLCEMICLIVMFKNYKKTKISNYTALFALVILSTLSAAIQSYYPAVLLTASTETFVLYIAYISIRNRQLNEKGGK